MKNIYDVIVIGLGVMGAAALWRTAAKCERCLGIDASGPTHCYGSSQGSSRIFRQAYWEGEKYLPLLQQADGLWNELELLSHRQLLFRTGGVFIGPMKSRVVAGSIKTARHAGIEHEVWTASETTKRLPAFNIQKGMTVVCETGAYAISACDARLEMLNEAVRCGATTVFGDVVVDIEHVGPLVHVTTNRGQAYCAKAVIITTGPWISTTLMPELSHYLEPRQVPVYWFKPKVNSEALFSYEQFPVFLYECLDGRLLYGVPSIISNEPGVKIGFHNRQQSPVTPDWKNMPVNPAYLDEISEVVKTLFPTLEPSPVRAKNCLYTMSPDESFLIGESQALKSVYFASACSGHGFKFAPAIGDALASMAIGQQPLHSLSVFSPNRFDSATHRL